MSINGRATWEEDMNEVDISKEEIKKWLDQYQNQIRSDAEELLDMQMPEVNEELFAIFEKTGSRIEYEEVYCERRKFLSVFGCMSILEPAEKHRRKLETVIRNICEEECWALPAHVNRASDLDWRNRVDLLASETANILAELSTLLREKLSNDIHVLIRENVQKRIFDPYLSKKPYATWENCEMNWNSVCNGNIGGAAIYLLQDKPEVLNQLLERVCDNLVHYLNGFSKEGVCKEGLSYYTYGFSFFVYFADLLSRYTEGKIELLNTEKCKKIAQFQQKAFFPSGRTLSFSDGNSRDRYRMGLTCYLAQHFESVKVPPIACAADPDADKYVRFASIYRDIFWTKKYLETETCEEAGKDDNIFLSEAQWGICHGASGGGMACKGGNNNEPHNHNDVGNFCYLVGDEMLLTDLGAGEYTWKYFSDKRYEILCNSSLGHNVPMIDGLGQQSGEEYACDSFVQEEKGTFVIHYASAYGNHKIKDLVRSLKYCSDTEVLEVTDTLQAEENLQPVCIKENLVTQYLPVIDDNEIRIQGSRYGCRIVILEGADTIRVEQEEHADRNGVKTEVYRILWDVPASKATEIRCHFRVIGYCI